MDAIILLDQLAEFQSKADFLELKRQELLSGVQIPAEILAAQDAANKERQRINSNLLNIQRSIEAEKSERIAAIPTPKMPPEYVAEMEHARLQGWSVEQDCAARIEAARVASERLQAALNAELQAKTAEVYRQVETRKSEINSEFSVKADAVKQNIDDLTKRIKDEVKAGGQSVKGKLFHAVYVKGRITWNTDMLEGLMISLPAIAKARKEGEPSVTIRKI